MAEQLPEETVRLSAVRALNLLDTAPEPEFDELALLASILCGTPVGVITVLEDGRLWFKARVGLPSLPETTPAGSFCSSVCVSGSLLEVEDARRDARFANHPLVTEIGVRFYAGLPLYVPGGHAVGTLCVADTSPRTLTAEQRTGLHVLARQVNGRLELRMQRKALEQTMREKDRVMEGLRQAQLQLEEANRKLSEQAVTDGLTGLRNRRYFEERLAIDFSMARRRHRALSVVMVDVDNFKLQNDRYGHAAGDAVLQRLSRCLERTVRLTDLAARYGGDEFAVLLPETDTASALLWTRRLQRAIAREFKGVSRIAVSMGVATLEDEIDGERMLVERADQALYAAKRAGKDRVHPYRDRAFEERFQENRERQKEAS